MSERLRVIDVREDIRADNARAAEQLRQRLAAHGTFLLNLMSSPGAGKTTLILATARRLAGRLRMAVVEADIDSAVDAEQVLAAGVPAVQLHTGGLCHLDATMVARGLEALDLSSFDLVVIENVGNLVCPAEFDTGATANAMILSVPEGDDKPLKYPLMFSVCDAVLVGKTDYLGLSDFDVERLRARVARLNPRAEIFEVSAKTGAGMDAWTEWLVRRVETMRQQAGTH